MANETRVSEWAPGEFPPTMNGVYQVRRIPANVHMESEFYWSCYNAQLKRFGPFCTTPDNAVKFQFLPGDQRKFEWRSKI